MKLGDYLRKCREQMKWTQPEAASKIDIEQSYLSKLETGKSFPSEDIFERIVDIYEIDLDSLFADIHSDELAKLKGLKQVRSAILKNNKQQQKELLPRIHPLEDSTYDDRGDAFVKRTLAGRRFYEKVSSRVVLRYSGHKWFLIPACAFLLGAIGSFYISRRWK